MTTPALGVTVVVLTFTLAWPQDVYEHLGLFTEVLADIQKDYVTEVSFTQLMHDATLGMLTTLDGDNEVLDRRHVSDHRAGDADVGLVVTRRKDDLTVVTSGDGSAARRAGLESGILWVRVHRMAPGVGEALTRALAGSSRAGLVLDLRDVGGGDVSDAVDLAQPFSTPAWKLRTSPAVRAGCVRSSALPRRPPI